MRVWDSILTLILSTGNMTACSVIPAYIRQTDGRKSRPLGQIFVGVGFEKRRTH